MIRKIIVKIIYLIQAIRRINRYHLGDLVIHAHEEYILTQGVSNPYWNLSGKIRLTRVHKDRFYLKNPILGRFERVKKYYKFKMDCWYSIDTSFKKSLFSPISKLY